MLNQDFQNQVRANKFDEWVGALQVREVIRLGVGRSILDVGCGIGQFTPMFLEHFARVVGLDPNGEYLKVARDAMLDGYHAFLEYIQGSAESFSIDEKFNTITMNNLLEHVDDPVAVLRNCNRHLTPNGRIIAQVPNANSVARRLGVLMGIIPSIEHISEKERDLYGHKRTYTMHELISDYDKAGLSVIAYGGILYKPLPNEFLQKLCESQGMEWTEKLIDALYCFGKDRPEECAQIYVAGY